MQSPINMYTSTFKTAMFPGFCNFRRPYRKKALGTTRCKVHFMADTVSMNSNRENSSTKELKSGCKIPYCANTWEWQFANLETFFNRLAYTFKCLDKNILLSERWYSYNSRCRILDWACRWKDTDSETVKDVKNYRYIRLALDWIKNFLYDVNVVIPFKYNKKKERRRVGKFQRCYKLIFIIYTHLVKERYLSLEKADVTERVKSELRHFFVFISLRKTVLCSMRTEELELMKDWIFENVGESLFPSLVKTVVKLPKYLSEKINTMLQVSKKDYPLLEKAIDYLEMGMYFASIKRLNIFLEENPSHYHVYNLRGLCYRALGKNYYLLAALDFLRGNKEKPEENELSFENGKFENFDGEWIKEFREFTGHGSLYIKAVDKTRLYVRWNFHKVFEGELESSLLVRGKTFHYGRKTVRYHGAFRNQMKHGSGVLKSKTGKVLQKGIWENGNFVERMKSFLRKQNGSNVMLDNKKDDELYRFLDVMFNKRGEYYYKKFMDLGMGFEQLNLLINEDHKDTLENIFSTESKEVNDTSSLDKELFCSEVKRLLSNENKKTEYIKLALVLGMSKYQTLRPLPGARENYFKVKKMFDEGYHFDFIFESHLDLEFGKLMEVVENFSSRRSKLMYEFPEKKVLTFVYFTGHGVFTDTSQCLIAKDFKKKYLESELLIQRNSISVKDIIECFQESNGKFCILLDCYSNEVRKEFQLLEPGQKRNVNFNDFIVSYSTTLGDDEANVYTKELVTLLEKKDVRYFGDILMELKNKVEAESKGKHDTIVDLTCAYSSMWPVGGHEKADVIYCFHRSFY